MSLSAKVLEPSEASKVSLLRKALKARLWSERASFSPGSGFRATCPLCGEPIKDGQSGDLHEALINRGKVPGHEYEALIYSRFNCVLAHHECHMRIMGTGGDAVFEKCARHIIRFEGRQAVVDWLETIQAYFPKVAGETLARLCQVTASEQEPPGSRNR